MHANQQFPTYKKSLQKRHKHDFKIMFQVVFSKMPHLLVSNWHYNVFFFVIFRSADKEEKENEPFTLYGTLPRSMRETKLLTNTREILDEDEVNRRKELILARSPTQLSEIHGLEDFPVPTRLQNLFQRFHDFFLATLFWFYVSYFLQYFDFT